MSTRSIETAATVADLVRALSREHEVDVSSTADHRTMILVHVPTSRAQEVAGLRSRVRPALLSRVCFGALFV